MQFINRCKSFKQQEKISMGKAKYLPKRSKLESAATLYNLVANGYLFKIYTLKLKNTSIYYFIS